MERVPEHAPQVVHGRLVRIDGQRLAAAQIADATTIVQTHDMVRMGVREEHRVEVAELLAQHLDAELWRGVNDQPGLVALDIDRWPHAVVLRVG